MRAVFTVDLPAHQGKYPSDGDIKKLMQSLGWDLITTTTSTSSSPVDLVERHKVLINTVVESMPETHFEKDFVCYHSYLPSEQSQLLVTRVIEGQITVRLQHEELGRLRRSAERVVRRLLGAAINGHPLEVVNQSVVIFEKEKEHIIVDGRVIPNAFKETWRTNKKDSLFAMIFFIFVIISLLWRQAVSNGDNELLSRFLDGSATGFFTAGILSLLAFLHAYWSIRLHKVIGWNIGGSNW
jgi:hypothetical protein